MFYDLEPLQWDTENATCAEVIQSIRDAVTLRSEYITDSEPTPRCDTFLSPPTASIHREHWYQAHTRWNELNNYSRIIMHPKAMCNLRSCITSYEFTAQELLYRLNHTEILNIAGIDLRLELQKLPKPSTTVTLL